ncbi:MAG: polymer-forming cytoskeletal protein [Planctomycetota bacterium]
MGLFGRKEAGPRVVRCPNCNGTQEVSAAAQSVVCHHCNVSMKVADQKITQYAATVALETSGSLTIERKGALIVQKRVVASNLTLRGSLKGNTFVYDAVHIASGAQLVGELKARRLQVDDGAALRGYLEILPDNGPVSATPKSET